MSSNFCVPALCCIAFTAGFCPPSAAASALRFADVVKLEGGELSLFDGMAIERLGLLACTGTACRPIPFQVDERDPAGRWVLDQGPMPTTDAPPGVLDANDLLLFMAADAGDRATPGLLLEAMSINSHAPRYAARGRRLLGVSGLAFSRKRANGRSPRVGPIFSGAVSRGRCGENRSFLNSSGMQAAPIAEITLRDPLDRTTRWVYLVAFADRAPRAAVANVAYDPATDRVRGRRVSLGFADGVPGYLAVGDGANLLDRLKVRASATFMFGLIHFARSEADLRTEFMGWHEGPIRVVRGQRQWVRLGWGIHSPTFGSYTYFYGDFAELPVGLYLNFKPTYFFGDILVQVILDFRDLRGWSVLVPGVPDPLPIDGTMTVEKAALESRSDQWFALRGPQITLVQSMAVSSSLATVRHRLLFRETAQPEPPEAVPGEAPGIGYQLDQWEHVGAGAHQLESVSYALPPEVDVREFMDVRRAPLEVSVRPLTRD